METLSPLYPENIRYFKETLRPSVNFDVIFRELRIGADEMGFFYIDGLTKDDMMQKLMQGFLSLGKLPIGASAANDFSATLPHVEVEVTDRAEQLLTAVLSGAAILFGSTFGAHALIIDTRTYPARSTEEPDDDRVMQGAHDGFVETLIFNTALIRRRLRDPRLSMRYMNLGGSSRTDVVICYVEGKADARYVRWLEGKLASIHPESVTLGAQSLSECLVRRRWYNPFPKIRYIVRPDAAAAELIEGRVLILCDNAPQALVLPTSIFDFMQETDDFYLPPVTGCYLRLLRHVILFAALFLIPTWYLLIGYAEILPPGLQFLVPDDTGTLPLFLQLFLAEFAVDGLKLASMNTPDMLTNSLSVIGGLILGEFAVDIGWLSPDVIFYIALVSIAGFSQQNHELGYAFKFLRMIWLAVTALAGIWGYFGFLLLIPILLVTNRTVNGGISYLYPLIPFNGKALCRLLFRLRKEDVRCDPYPKTVREMEREDNTDLSAKQK